MQHLKLFVFCTSLVLSTINLSAFAPPQDSSYSRSIDIKELVVVNKAPTMSTLPKQTMAVLSRSTIEKVGVETLQDLLLYIRGVDLRTRGGNGIQADVSIRGGTFDQTIVMLNGVNLTDPQTGHHSLNIPLPIAAIEYVEILQGIGFAGAINIVTKRPTKSGLEASMVSGMHGLGQGAILGEINLSSISLLIGGDINRSSGFTNNTDYLHGNTYLKVGYRNEKIGNFDFQGGFQAKNFGANSFYSVKYKEQYEETRVWFTSAHYNRTINEWHINLTGYVRQHFDLFKLFRYQTPEWYKGDNNHRTLVSGGDFGTSYQSEIGITKITTNVKTDKIDSNTLGNRCRNFAGLGIEQNIKANIFTTNFGVNGIWNNDYGIHWSGVWSGNVELPYHFEVKALAQKVYRLPTFTDLYYDGPTQKGNSDLKPEQAVVGEMSINWKPDKLRFGMTGYYRYGFQIIDWVREAKEDTWRSANMTDVQSVGGDFSAYYFADGKILQQVGLQYNFLHVIKKTSQLSLYATDYLKHQLKFNIHHLLYWKVFAVWQFNFQDRAGTYLNFVSNREVRYEPYLLCNLKIMVKLDKIDFFGEGNNLFNVKYYDLGNIDQPGIWIKGGIKVKI